MILILTTDAGDFSHPKFIDWLHFYKADYEILTGESIYEGKTSLIIENNQLFINGRNYTKDVNVVFNRRWLTTSELPAITNDNILNQGIKNTLSAELYELRNFLNCNLKNALWIPNIQNLNVNKISILQKAHELGIKLPKYIITNKKDKVLEFFETHKTIITKAIGNFPKNYIQNNFLVNPIYTKVISKDLIDQLPETFFMSIFQEYIPKYKEYRVLYFEGACLSVEIGTQENDFSIIDSRAKGDNKQEVRIQKAKLPRFYEKQIDLLMKSIGLNIGSIDVIENEKNEFFFLEVNPVGQISGYSLRGNLDFEKNIVEKMIKLDNEIEGQKQSIH
ncbi:hypothetical protein AB832_01710 [Flavobacteriaceae bacterium (ex Bugula neritina AB1)]|nr:hypothetical protein AB832_01710 [Flavobacteriaceae bacterium (ex Bugula neritina AB1)]